MEQLHSTYNNIKELLSFIHDTKFSAKATHNVLYNFDELTISNMSLLELIFI